jgi:hypothetical protein
MLNMKTTSAAVAFVAIGGPPVLDSLDRRQSFEDTIRFGGDADAVKTIGRFGCPVRGGRWR